MRRVLSVVIRIGMLLPFVLLPLLLIYWVRRHVGVGMFRGDLSIMVELPASLISRNSIECAAILICALVVVVICLMWRFKR